MSVFHDHETSASSRSATRPAWRRWLIEVERGLSASFRGDSTLFGYCFAATIVLSTGFVLNIGILEWAVVSLSLSVAASAEMFQMVIRAIADDISDELSKNTRKSLRIGLAAVLVTRLGAFAAVLMIYGARVLSMWRQ